MMHKKRDGSQCYVFECMIFSPFMFLLKLEFLNFIFFRKCKLYHNGLIYDPLQINLDNVSGWVWRGISLFCFIIPF